MMHKQVSVCPVNFCRNSPEHLSLEFQIREPPSPLKIEIKADLGTLSIFSCDSKVPPPIEIWADLGTLSIFSCDSRGPESGRLYVETNFCIPRGYYLVVILVNRELSGFKSAGVTYHNMQ